MKNVSIGTGLSKSGLLLEFWGHRCQFLGRIRRWIFSPETAEDVFQEACLKFLASSAVFPYPEAATKYFCRILHSLIVQHITHAARLEYRAVLPELCCEPQAEWERGMLLNCVADAVGRLSTSDRRLLAVYLNPESGRLRDKCKILGLPNSTMRYQYSRLIRRLRRTVEKSS